MQRTLILFIMLLASFYCQLPLSEFKNQFLLEINKFKPSFEDKDLEKMITKIAKTFFVEESFTNKVVDLENISNNCHLDFERDLVKSETLPSSNHLINQIIIGGLLRPGEEPEPNKNDLWAANIGVAIKKDSKTVYSLVYDLLVHFDKQSFAQRTGLDLKDIDEETLAYSIFYNKCLEIAQNEMIEMEIDDPIEEEFAYNK